MKMKKTDIVVVGFMYAICGVFGYLNMNIKAEAQTYPWFVIGLLFVLTTMYTIKMILQAIKEGTEGGWSEAFEGFLAKQFIPIAILIIAYALVMKFLGFYIATFLFVVGTLLFLKVPKWQIAIVIVVMFALTYGAFTMFLGVKLPKGLLLKALF